MSEADYQQTRAYLLSIGTRIEILIQLEKALTLKLSWLHNKRMSRMADEIIRRLEIEYEHIC